MKKILKGNVITGDEKLFLQFELGKKKQGIEKLFLEDSISANNLQQSENNSIKIGYVIKDDYDEKIVKGDSAARIGTTLVNLMNARDKISPMLIKYYNLIQNFDINTVQEIYTDIGAIINEFKLKELKTDYEIDEALLEIYQKIATKDDEELKSCKQLIQTLSAERYADKDFLYILKFIEKLFGIKNNNNYNYYNRSDFIWIATEILGNNEDDIQAEYNFLLLNVVKELEKRLTQKLKENEALKSLIGKIFRNFYNDYNFASDPNNLYSLLENIRSSMQNNPYNPYYKNMYEYISNLENKKADTILERFEKFSLKEMSKIFVETLIEDIDYISSNYNDVSEATTNAIIISKNTYKYEISSFYELFHISKYYIKEDGNNLKACNLCGKYFITQGKVTEQHCRRMYTKKLNCSEYVNYNTRKSNSSGSQCSKELNRIKAMLRKRDSVNKTDELVKFNEKLRNKKTEIKANESTPAKIYMKLLDWLKEEHKELKKYK